MKLFRSFLLTTLAAGILNASAFAQEPPVIGGVGSRRTRRPTITPYLNLLNRQRDSDLGLQYFGIVRPEIQMRSAINSQSRSLGRLQRQVDDQNALIRNQNSQLGATGHEARFLNLGSYFGGRATGAR